MKFPDGKRGWADDIWRKILKKQIKFFIREKLPTICVFYLKVSFYLLDDITQTLLRKFLEFVKGVVVDCSSYYKGLTSPAPVDFLSSNHQVKRNLLDTLVRSCWHSTSTCRYIGSTWVLSIESEFYTVKPNVKKMWKVRGVPEEFSTLWHRSTCSVCFLNTVESVYNEAVLVTDLIQANTE